MAIVHRALTALLKDDPTQLRGGAPRALRRRSLYDRLRAIAEYDYTRRPNVALVLAPSPWEQRLTGEFCLNADLRDYYVGLT